jgi:hypothetical protein
MVRGEDIISNQITASSSEDLTPIASAKRRIALPTQDSDALPKGARRRIRQRACTEDVDIENCDIIRIEPVASNPRSSLVADSR